MKKQVFILIIGVVFCGLSCNKDVPETMAKPFIIKGIDGSFIPDLRNKNIEFKNTSNQVTDIVELLQTNGVNTIRLRLWHTPASSSSSLSEVAAFAEELKQKGFKIWLCIHYSDTWADPGNQHKPKAWEKVSGNDLADSLYNYTYRVVNKIEPDFVQIGNEINSGFMWPDGSNKNAFFHDLIKTGLRAAKQAHPQAERMIHIAGSEGAENFFNQLNTSDYEIIGISYYPWWHGNDLALLEERLNDLSSKFNKKIVIAETSYPFTLNWQDTEHNVVGLENQLHPDYEATKEGQKAFLQTIYTISTRINQGYGFCYWGGEWVAYRGSVFTEGSSWENLALFDFNRKKLPALAVFNQ